MYDLTLTDPSIELMDQRMRITRSEELFNVFELEDIKIALANNILEETPYQPNNAIVEKGSPN